MTTEIEIEYKTPTKHLYEMNQDEYIKRTVLAETVRYDRAITSNEAALKNPNARISSFQRKKIEMALPLWKRQLDRMRSGDWGKQNLPDGDKLRRQSYRSQYCQGYLF